MKGKKYQIFSRLANTRRWIIGFTGLFLLSWTTQLNSQLNNPTDSLQMLVDKADGADKFPFILDLFNQVFPHDLKRSVALCNQAKSILLKYPSEKNRFELYKIYGDLYRHQGKYDSLLIMNKEGLILAQNSNDKKEESNFLSRFGNYQEEVGTVDSAILFYEKAIAVAGKDSLSLYNSIGQAHSRKGDYEKGSWYLERAMMYARANNMKSLEASITLNIGSDYYDTGNMSKAIDYFERSLLLAEEIEHEQNMLASLLNLSYAVDVPDEKRKYAFRGKRIAEEIEDYQYRLYFISNIAGTYIDEGKYQVGIDILLPAYQSLNIDLGRDKQGIVHELSRAYSKLGQFDKAVTYGQEAYNIAKTYSGLTDLQFARTNLLEVFTEQKNYKRYFEIAQEYYPQRDSLYEFERIERFSELEALLDEEQKEKVNLLNTTIEEKEKSQWQLGIIGLLILSMLLLLLYFRSRRVALQKEIIRKEKESAEELQKVHSKLQELDRFKSRLYTNISHEFRTPLTVILGMTAQLETHPDLNKAGNTDETINRKLKLIQRNGESLLDLVTKMLDLSKLENNTIRVNYVQGNIIKYLRYLGESYYSLMETRNINFSIETDYDKVIMDYDAEKMRQIISNLISNAVKYTPPNGSILLKIDRMDAVLKVAVIDSGEGIPPTNLPHIFNRFYQADDATSKAGGTGIGLALTKELVDLMDGSISVESELTKGSTFRVNLPIKKESKVIADIPNITPDEYVKAEAIVDSKAGAKPSLLIIEDNADVAEYISSCLRNQYDVNICYDGSSGVDHALNSIPDLIISDVMMPGKDGYEVCEILKLDTRTSHIPIILLTAKGSMEERLQGLEIGADEYLIKPFNSQELEIRVRKLIELRESLRQQYAQSDFLNPPVASMSTVDKKFIESVAMSMEKHLADGSFGVHVLAQEVNMSKVHLNRKMNALMDLSANKYIQAFRLQRAYHMLLQKTGNVSEIALDTGFNSISYFSKCFREKFDMTPKELLEQL